MCIRDSLYSDSINLGSDKEMKDSNELILGNIIKLTRSSEKNLNKEILKVQ